MVSKRMRDELDHVLEAWSACIVAVIGRSKVAVRSIETANEDPRIDIIS